MNTNCTFLVLPDHPALMWIEGRSTSLMSSSYHLACPYPQTSSIFPRSTSSCALFTQSSSFLIKHEYPSLTRVRTILICFTAPHVAKSYISNLCLNTTQGHLSLNITSHIHLITLISSIYCNAIWFSLFYWPCFAHMQHTGPEDIRSCYSGNTSSPGRYSQHTA